MPVKRRKQKRLIDEKRAVNTELEKKEYEARIDEIAQSFEGIDPEKVRETMHPFETAGICGDKPLSLTQKMMTFCINHLGGAASDEEILGFLRRFWADVVPADPPKPIPDKRVLHINLTIQKERRPLFVKAADGSDRWSVNKANAPMEQPRKFSSQVTPFQDRMLAVLRAHEEGLTLEDLTHHCEEFADVEGNYQHLPLLERVRTCLTVKQMIKDVVWDENEQKWFAENNPTRGKKFRIEDFLTTSMKGMKVKDLSVNELWSVLKDRKVY